MSNLTDLKLFVEKTDKLLCSSFAANVLTQRISCSMAWKVDEGMTISSTEFDQEHLDAFMLTFRMLIQDNDRISIRRIGQIFQRVAISQQLKESLEHVRDQLNLFLDSPPFFSAWGTPATYRDVLETILYGDLSHIGATERALYERWMADPFVAQNMMTQFLMILQNFLTVISALKIIVSQAVLELECVPQLR